MIRKKVYKILLSAGVVASVIGVSPVILSHAQTFNNENTYKVDSSNRSIQKAVVNTTVNLSNGTANKYDMVVITGENGNYYNIITQYGVTGSIPKSDLTIVKSGTGNKLIKLNEIEHVIHVTTVLNVREQPDVHSGLLTTLKEDTNIQVTGQEGEWLQVNINGQIGYVYNDFVEQGTIGNVTIDQATTNVKNMTVKSYSKNVVSNNSQSTNVQSSTVNVQTVVNEHNNRAPQESNSSIPAVVHTSNRDNIVTKPNTVKPNGNGGEIVNLPQPAQINSNGGTSQNMPNIPVINVNPGNQGSGESNQPQGGQPSQGGQNTPAPSQGQGNQPQHQVKPEQPAQQGGQANKGDVKPSVKPEQPQHHQDAKPSVKPEQPTKPVVPEHHEDVQPEHHQDVKPVQQQVTKTVLEVETLCNGKEVKGATYCILGTGKYEGQNFTTNGKEMVLTLDSADVTGANLTILPNGYGFVKSTTNKVVSVKDGVRTIKVVTKLKVDKSNEPQHQVKHEQPQSGESNNKGQTGTPDQGQSSQTTPGHKTDVKPVQPSKPSKPVVTMVPVTTEIVSSNGTVLVTSKTVEVAKGNPLDLSYIPQIPQGYHITKIIVNGINETNGVHGDIDGATKIVVTVTPNEAVKPVVPEHHQDIKPLQPEGNKDHNQSQGGKAELNQPAQPEHHQDVQPTKPVKPVVKYGTINILMKDTQGNLIGQEQTAKGVVGSVDTLSIPAIPAGYKEVSMTVNGTAVNSLPSKFEAGTQNVVIIVKKLDASVKVVFECNGTPLTTETHMMKVGSELNDSLIPTSLSKHYTIDSIIVDGQATGKTISGTVQEGNNVIVVNLTKKVVAPTGWTANSQAFHQAVAQEFATLLANQRAQAGVGALPQNADANEIAQIWSNHQAETNICSDITNNPGSQITSLGNALGGIPFSNSAVTSIRTTTGLTQHDADKLAQQIFEMWMQSPIHRGTMDTTSAKEYGFAFTVNPNGTVYATMALCGVNMSGIDFGN